MTEPQSAIGRVQLPKLEAWVEQRRANAQRLIDRFAETDIVRVPVPPNNIEHAYYRLYCYVQPERLKAGWTRDRIIAEVEALGVPIFSGSCSEIYLEKAFTDSNLTLNERLPVAKELGETSLAFLVHPTMAIEDIDRVADAFLSVAKQASR
jgi:dTDP-4-amino-4,6-dideoxygalactose transaminase